MPLIEAQNISVNYSGLAALAHVSLAIERGEIVTVVGPNGSGKSSLIRALIGAIPLSAGRIARMPRLKVGYVPQKLAIDATMPITVSRFLDLPHKRSPKARADAIARTRIDGLLGRQMTDLSGGQFQRALLARAIMDQPDILILDEPTQGLDQPGTADFYHMLEDLRRDTGCAILLVSHDLHVVMSASDRVICLNGHICCEGTPAVVLEAPEYRALFGPGTGGTMALYRHEHDHTHSDAHEHGHHDHHA